MRIALERLHGMPRTWRFRLDEYSVMIEFVTEPPSTRARKRGWNQPGSSPSVPATASDMSACVAAATPATPSATEETSPPSAPLQVIERSEVVRGR